jgi:endonuclease YncB( thermonuclease family)
MILLLAACGGIGAFLRYGRQTEELAQTASATEQTTHTGAASPVSGPSHPHARADGTQEFNFAGQYVHSPDEQFISVMLPPIPGGVPQAALPNLVAVSDASEAPIAEERLREWVERTGPGRIRAKLTAISFDRVMLIREDGTQHEVSLEFLSDGDREYVANRVRVGTVQGRIVSLSDGDSVRILSPQNLQFHLRLTGIDAPERGQAFGQRAREALGQMVFEKDVRAELRSRDRFGRLRADLYVGDLHVNREMIRQGFAWHYTQFDSRQELADAETEARRARRGLWQDAAPIAPWDFRTQQRAR